MRYMGDVGPHTFDPKLGLKPLSRDQLIALMASAPPAATITNSADLQFAIENADILRDDYAEPLVEFSLATNVGKKKKVLYIGIGAVAGLAVGALAMKLIGG